MSPATSSKLITGRELHAMVSLKPHLRGASASSLVTHFMAHGALQSFVQPSTIAAKHAALEKTHPAKMTDPDVNSDVQSVLEKMQAMAASFFTKLDPSFQYEIPSSLMSYLTRPGKGKMYDEGYQPSDLPASITFMGQFIDHDLTKNATNLVDPENNSSVPTVNVASPLIDLDSVYGPRSDEGTGGAISPKTGDGRFKLTKLDDSNNAYDVQRVDGAAQIEDGRNDENQLILQVHLLVMRVHNLLIKEKGMTYEQARRETIFNWQSVVLHDHQPSVLDKTIFGEVLEDLANAAQNPPRLKYRPQPTPKLPHEFALAFRYGHSQLRDAYFVGPGRSFVLFDNLDPGPAYKDLRGGRPMTADRAVDWSYFINPADDNRKSNRLDTHIASAVFDLPESAVPDMPTKFLGNLPQRNLIRSREIGLTSGEKLFDFYFGASAPGKLTPDQVEADATNRKLFEFTNGAGFQTPLWYYILREAELAGGLRLGKLGSRLVGEVVGGAIYYDPEAYVHFPDWRSAITDKVEVKLADLVEYVKGKDAT